MEYINNKLEEFKRYIKAKNVAIIGLGVSNIPLINYLYNLGAIITVFDQKTEAELNEEALENVKAKGFNIITGKECLKEVQSRNIVALDNVLSSYKGKNIVIGSHGTALSAIINYYDKSFGYNDFEKIRFLMPWIVEFSFEDKKCIGIRMHNLFEY